MVDETEAERARREAVIEVEVERLPAPDEGGGPAGPREERARQLRELGGTLGPLMAGFLIDVLDAATVTPLFGLVLGWPLGYYILRQVGCAHSRALQLGVLIGLYCALPGTFALPVATLVGAAVKLRQVFAPGR